MKAGIRPPPSQSPCLPVLWLPVLRMLISGIHCFCFSNQGLHFFLFFISLLSEIQSLRVVNESIPPTTFPEQFFDQRIYYRHKRNPASRISCAVSQVEGCSILTLPWFLPCSLDGLFPSVILYTTQEICGVQLTIELLS